RVPRLFDALALARGDGRHARLLKTLSRVDLLILDDWGLAPVTLDQARDLLEIVDDRHGRGSTIDPIADRALARDDPKSDYRRRHSGSARAQRPSPDLEGGKHAKIGRQTIRA